MYVHFERSPGRESYKRVRREQNAHQKIGFPLTQRECLGKFISGDFIKI